MARSVRSRARRAGLVTRDGLCLRYCLVMVPAVLNTTVPGVCIDPLELSASVHDVEIDVLDAAASR